MFQLMGAGDKAGSGLDKIRASWANARLRSPSLTENPRPDRVRLDLPMSSVLPDEAVGQLANHFGLMFNDLDPGEVQILVMAFDEGPITNARLQDVLAMHRVDLTKVLQNLVRLGFLEREGFGRWTTYQLPAVIDRRSPAGSVEIGAQVRNGDDGTGGGTSEGTNDGSHVGTSDDGDGTPSTKDTNPALWNRLLEIGQPARARRIMSTTELSSIVTRLCREAGWLTRDELGELVGRNGYNLRDRTLASMVTDGRLVLRYPARNHPNQAYAAGLLNATRESSSA